jgi:hypothetical protein
LGGREQGRSQLPQPQAACGRRLWRARKEGPKSEKPTRTTKKKTKKKRGPVHSSL